MCSYVFFFFQAEDGIRDLTVTGVQTCALPISFAQPRGPLASFLEVAERTQRTLVGAAALFAGRSEEHTSELQSQSNLVCRLLLEKKKKYELSKLARRLTPHSTTSIPRHMSHTR